MKQNPFLSLPRFYGRRKGKALRDAQKRRMEEILPRVHITPDDFKQKQARQIFENHFAKIGRKLSSVALEIGFGRGDHLAFQAEQNPETCFLGADPFMNAVAGLLAAIEEKDLQNILVFPDDVRLLFAALPDNVFDKIYLLFPDPWPKKRHESRRFVNQKNLDDLARLLVPGGVLRLASDDWQYILWSLVQISQHSAFAIQDKAGEVYALPREGAALSSFDPQNLPDLLPPAFFDVPADWVTTGYEDKARRKGVAPIFLDIQRLS